MSSIRKTPCGPPKPRKAVLEVLFVLATRPSAFTFGIQYALSMWQSARLSTGSDRSRHHPPSAVRVASSARMPPSVVEARAPRDVERMPLAGHRDVLRAVQPQAHRAASELRAESGDRGQPVRLHLLAAECAAHPQRLHGDPVGRDAQHVRDDLLRLARDAASRTPRSTGPRSRGARATRGSRGRSAPDRRTRSRPRTRTGRLRARSRRLRARRCARRPDRSSAAIASVTVITLGSGSYSTVTAAAPRRAASGVSPSTQTSAWP